MEIPITPRRTLPRISLTLAALTVALLLSGASVCAQEPAQPAAISPRARLMAARSIFIEPASSSIPYDVIGDAFQGWGHYELAADPAKADLIVSIVAPPGYPSASVGGNAKNRPATPDDVTKIRLLILDAHDRAVLWSSSEQPKPALNEKRREDQLVDASLRLFRRFRDTIEPEPGP